MRIKKILSLIIIGTVSVLLMALILKKSEPKVEIESGSEVEVKVENETNSGKDEELLNILTNDEPVPSNGSITMTGIFRKRNR